MDDATRTITLSGFATCSVGTKKKPVLAAVHYQNINKANATQTGLSGAYRFDINHIPLDL